MPKSIRVGMSEIVVAEAPDILVTIGLGSCIGVCVYDPVIKVGGMAHIMLPDSTAAKEVTNRGKFADTAIPDLVELMQKKGAIKQRMLVKKAGGAQMFAYPGTNSQTHIGYRNAVAAEKALEALGLKVSGKSIGGHSGRSIYMDLATGVIRVKTLNSPEIIL